MVLVEGMVFLIAFVLLVKGSDYFVEAASDLAQQFGVSAFVIGLTIVAVGTSIPELASSVAAALKGSAGIVMGNVVGSNIANVGLIVGISLLLGRVKTDRQMLRRDGYLMLFSAAILFMFMLGGGIAWSEALVMLGLYAAYLIFLLEEESRDLKEQKHLADFLLYVVRFRFLNTLGQQATRAVRGETKQVHRRLIIRDVTIILLSLVAVVVGAKYLVEEALYFAQLLAIPEAIIGVTIIAIGTSLPELSVTVSAIRKNLGDIAVGNIIGSNIANALLITGVAGLVTPLGVSRGMLSFSAPFMIGISALLLIFIRTGWGLSRREGIALLTTYAVFLAVTVMWPSLA